MSVRNFNNTSTVGTLTGPVASSAVTLSVNTFTQVPAVPFTATLDRNLATEEVVLVTAIAGGTLTVTRGYDGTAAQAHSAGGTIEHTAGAIEYTQANQHVNATTGVHGTAGSLVGTDGSQTLFSKTLVSPVLTADPAAGDAAVAFIPPGSEARNLFRGVGSDGNDKVTVNSSGKITTVTDTAVGGNLTVTGTSTTGAATINGTATVTSTAAITGLITATGGITVPIGSKATLTDLPTAATHAANKQYVDASGVAVPTVSTIMRRDSAGRAQVVDPAAAADIATKHYVDGKFGDTGYVNLTLTSPLTTGAAGATYRVLNGICYVEIHGVYSGSWAANFVITALPVGARPGRDKWEAGDFFGSGSNYSQVRFQADGNVVVVYAIPSALGLVVATSFPVS